MMQHINTTQNPETNRCEATGLNAAEPWHLNKLLIGLSFEGTCLFLFHFFRSKTVPPQCFSLLSLTQILDGKWSTLCIQGGLQIANRAGKRNICVNMKWHDGTNILQEVSLMRYFQLQREDSQTTITAHILQPVSPPNEMSHTWWLQRWRHT